MNQEQKEKQENANVARGVWGEDVALAFLRSKGWRLVDRRVRPCARDRRGEIDLIVRTRDRRGVAFVEVKTHRARSPRATRLWSVNKRKKSVLLRACSCWIISSKPAGKRPLSSSNVPSISDSISLIIGSLLTQTPCRTMFRTEFPAYSPRRPWYRHHGSSDI